MNTHGASKRPLVSHPVFGDGEVLSSRSQGAELLVRFQSGLQLWLSAARCRLLSPAETVGAKQPLGRDNHLDRVQACRMIEAFRLGIVPRQDIEVFTFGRAEACRQIEGTLNALVQGKGGLHLIEGEYGTGKTHLLEFALHRALRRGLAVSTVQFDLAEVAPYRPKRVYREIVHNFRYLQDGREFGFRDLLLMAALAVSGISGAGSQSPFTRSRAPAGHLMSDHIFFGPVLRRLARHPPPDAAGEVMWQWLEGESTKEYATDRSSPYRVKGGQRIPALYDFSTAADFYCYVISGLAWLCRQLGLGGMVLLIDEAETVTHIWDILCLTRSVAFLDGLVRTAQGDRELLRVSPLMLHNRVRPVPYLYRQSFLLVLLATTPAPNEYAYIRLMNRAQSRFELAPLAEGALTEAFSKMVTVYQCAYPDFRLPDPVQRDILNRALRHNAEGIRAFLKFCIEAFDVARLRRAG